jgi:hypothetical protein
MALSKHVINYGPRSGFPDNTPSSQLPLSATWEHAEQL